ncbi:tetratricopeptide repeat protein [candidate division WOR-3 bacterium]|uniref:Tetratricopeptide repeat protein n=1 Tax=candidate division WOR-3 bacterium TaxID=2052148 RepID=A0A9D5QD93_UNCW3|nr:tetratricopeptide repeat protein [candidate division WOR-3 bacterium]MBD3365503.1 tetratricopeptide repeat protein [candidate division WOR-3 bacterium]
MAGERIKKDLLIAGILTAVTVAVLPPLLLKIPVLWFICPGIGGILLIGILFLNRVIVGISAVLLIAGLVVTQIFQPVPLSADQGSALDALGYFINGEVHHLRLEYDEAIDAYDRAERAGLSHPWMRYQKFRAYASSNRPGHYQKAFENIFNLMYDAPHTFSQELLYPDYGKAAMDVEEIELGLQAFTNSIRLNYSPGFCYYNLGLYHKNNGRLSDADSLIKAAHKMGYDKSECSRQLAEISNIQKAYDSSEFYYIRALRENYEDAKVYNGYGVFLAKLRRLDEAVEVFEKGDVVAKSIGFNRNPVVHTQILINLAYVYAEKGQTDRALITFARIPAELPANPLFITAFENWADLYLKLGDRRKAYGKLKDALRAAEMVGDTGSAYRIRIRMRAFMDTPSSLRLSDAKRRQK